MSSSGAQLRPEQRATSKTASFRRLLESPALNFLCEAHNGLSAKIAEEAKFDGIWASGLSISAQLGVRDSNEASWTQVLDVVEFMADATHIPILLDGDTGYGNFNNVQRLVRKLEQRGLAAVCIEDKLFPKTNSFIAGDRQPLADVEEFCGKIRAGKDAQADDDFCIIARVEALIAGWGMGEALRRAEAYHAAGADGILIHSALSRADEVLGFKREWGDRCPVLIVPTRYYATPTSVFRDAGFSLVIWANHILRASLTAMQKAAATIHESESVVGLEHDIVPVSEVFRLQGASDLEKAEQRYLPRQGSRTQVVVLAASRGVELGELTEHKPKAMVSIAGTPLLGHIVSSFNAAGIKDITVVRGYRREAVNLPNLRYVDNEEYADSGELVSVQRALRSFSPDEKRETVICYGDVLFKKYVPEILLDVSDELAIIVDTHWRESTTRTRADFVTCTSPFGRTTYNKKVLLKRIDPTLTENDSHGEWMGFLKVAGGALDLVCRTVDRMLLDPANRYAKVPNLINALVESAHPVRVVYTTGHWLDIDRLDDVVQAGSF
jgi:phosphoenolpyruvate phosphomutase